MFPGLTFCIKLYVGLCLCLWHCNNRWFVVRRKTAAWKVLARRVDERQQCRQRGAVFSDTSQWLSTAQMFRPHKSKQTLGTFRPTTISPAVFPRPSTTSSERGNGRSPGRR